MAVGRGDAAGGPPAGGATGPAGAAELRPPRGRLTPGPTCRVDFSRPLDFRFLGQPMTGFAGDTVASALYANGVRIFSRSLKYHRPRGLYSMEGESSNTLVEIDGVPNECAETTKLRAGMSVRAQNVRGDPRTDRFGFIDAFDRLLPAGFYYRLFHRPYRLWPLFQNGLRRMAGTGVLDPRQELDGSGQGHSDTRRQAAVRKGSGSRTDGVQMERYLNADVAVVGSGAAGMAAALAAAESGLRVCLFERRPWLGGHLAWRVREYEGEPLHRRGDALATRLRATGNVRVFANSPVTGVWGENLVTGFTVGGEGDPFRECHWECRAKAVVVAAGRMERPLVFNHNDRPGVMQAATAWRLARSYAVLPGRAVVFSVADDGSLEAAVDLADLGVRIRAVADAREPGRQDPALVTALEERGIPLLPGWAASRAMGRKRVTGCELRALRGAGARRLRCDLLVANAGWQPRIGALATAGARLAYCTHTHTFQPAELPGGVFAAGSLTGLRDPRSIEASGRLAGYRAAEWCGSAAPRVASARRECESLPGPEPGCDIRHGPAVGRGAKAFVDLDEDGTCKNVVESAAQGFDVPELAKRFGGFGLGPGQYRVTGQNLAMIMADLRGDPLETASPTTVRPPLTAPSLATLAGPGHDVHKRTPLHGKLAARGAVFRRAGPWVRARYFGRDPRHGADDESVQRLREEILNVRRNVGILDSSPLGKFRIFGPDALKALQRVYISDISRARPGRCIYSALCNNMAHVLDDGAIVMESERNYYFTTSSGRAGSTVEWFRHHTRHDGWDFHLVNLTDAFGSINLAGPNARRVLERVTDDDISNEAFPYMRCRWITVGEGGARTGPGGARSGRAATGVHVRSLRLGFVGELSYELHVPSSYCQYVWDLLVAAGADIGIQPFGLEAQYCLRAEKGHIIVGAESEARVTLTDLRMGWLWDREDTASKKVGAPALRACAEQPGRMKLVGFRVEEVPGAPRDGAVVVAGGEIVGYVCTTRRSDTLGWQYGMALVREEHAERGGRLQLCEDEGRGTRATWSAVVVKPPFYDPGGARLRA
ncbi:MAG: FAD-dependent oxidoreductase [Gemmatimonadetes bacterium]|nr:FAD-dependent oxidoreductase [Gemmatimonadota bacterium]MYD12285.1 FAD-dependent oxidoreductase [Gemmatimonadota bacterium]